MASVTNGPSRPGADRRLLFVTRSLRMFAYGGLSVVLALYLSAEGVHEERVGWILTAALLGDIAISLWLSTSADSFGRRRTLVIGALLMAAAGAVFASTTYFPVLLVAATVGVLSASDKEVGPFLSIEQAALSQTVRDEDRTGVFAWYHVAGSVAAALGCFAAGLLSEGLLGAGRAGSAVYQPVVVWYAAAGLLLAAGFCLLSPAAEPERQDVPRPRVLLGLHRSRGVVLRLSALFALDAFGGGFVLLSLVAFWLHERYGLEPAELGGVFMVSNLLAAGSGLIAARLAKWIGLVETMVFTHLPSNVLLILVPFMPEAELAVALLLLRACISQMDVPTRQSYTMAVVTPDERSAAAGVTAVARSVGAAASPVLAGYLLADPRLMGLPFVIAGVVKIVYDVWLYRAFVGHEPEAAG